MTAVKHLPTIAWRTLIQNVVMLSPTTYRVNVKPIDTGEPGARTREIGNYLKDHVGHTYIITDSDSTTVTIQDDFGIGLGPQSGKQGIIYKSVGKGTAPYLAPIYYRHLDRSALEYSRRFELDILWRNDPNAIKIEFTNTLTPKIEDYQDNYADMYGELPKVQLITYDSEGVEWGRQEVPIWYRTGGLLTSIEWDLSSEYSGYIILSK
jgi:hypothetical protein